jgi:hypothetical protein
MEIMSLPVPVTAVIIRPKLQGLVHGDDNDDTRPRDIQHPLVPC